MNINIDYSLYLVTDRTFLNGRSLSYCVEEAIKGGTTMVQIREKDCSTREFLNVAKEIKQITSKYNVPLIINDRIDIAQAIDADGVHLGQNDMTLSLARKILGNNKIIGISAGNITEALEAQKNGADYLGIGAIFYTNSKKDINTPLGIDGLKNITEQIKIPSVAIGGINKTNTANIIKSGVNGVSVISAILNSDNIQLSAELLSKTVRAAKKSN